MKTSVPFHEVDMEIQYFFVNEMLKQKIISYRRDFHRHPELGWMEQRTTDKIAGCLRELGYKVYVGFDVCDNDSRMDVPKNVNFCTGVIGVLKGTALSKNASKPKVTALRFDMDALPIHETLNEKNQTYCSKNDGVMHACGHDGHMAVGLGLAEILSEHKSEIGGEIRLIFQPAEEGCKGSQSIVSKGWLDNVDEFYSGHIGIGCRELGRIGVCIRGFMASTKMNVYFHGIAAHAANAPETGRNALLAAAEFTVKAYEFYKACPEKLRKDTRMNVGRLVSGNGRNIIADEAYLEVETRGVTSESNLYMKEKICKTAQGTGKDHDVICEIKVVGDVVTGKSDQMLACSGYDVACEMGIGDKFIHEAEFSASEDAVTMMNRVQQQGGKAAYFMFGTELAAEHHHPCFDFNEDVLPLMAEFYAKLLVKKQNDCIISGSYDV